MMNSWLYLITVLSQLEEKAEVFSLVPSDSQAKCQHEEMDISSVL